MVMTPRYLVTIANLSFPKHLFAYYDLQKNWSTTVTNSTHVSTPEIPLPESMVGQPSPGKRTLLQAMVLAPHCLVSIANLPFSKHLFAEYHLQRNWTAATSNSVHADIPEIPLPESMAGQPSLANVHFCILWP